MEDSVGVPEIEAVALFDAVWVNTLAGSTLADTEMVPEDDIEDVMAPVFEAVAVPEEEAIAEGVRDAEAQYDVLTVSLGDCDILLETVCVTERDWVTVIEPDDESDAVSQADTERVGFP